MEDGGDVCRKPYGTFIEELSIVHDVILKGQCVVVPAIMKAEMLQLIHEGHLGIEKCKRQARDILYWPNMNQDVYDTVSQCDVCQEYRYPQPQQPLQIRDDTGVMRNKLKILTGCLGPVKGPHLAGGVGPA